MERRARLRKIIADMDDNQKVEKLGKAFINVLLRVLRQSHLICWVLS